MPNNDLLFEAHDGIGRITFNRPQARNAFTFAMYERLAQICEQANSDRSIKVLVLQGAGDKAFASGTDINQFRAFTTPQHALDYESRIDRVLTQLEQCRVPTIAAITGACTGGGAGIAACCDLRIGTKTTKMGFPIARGFDQATDATMRQFFYLPLMHSEELADQERCVRLYQALGDPELLKYAHQHHEIIARFGRFPHRNRLMARDTAAEEQAFLDGGGFAG